MAGTVSVIGGATLAEFRDGIADETLNERLTAAFCHPLRRLGQRFNVLWVPHRRSAADIQPVLLDGGGDVKIPSKPTSSID